MFSLQVEWKALRDGRGLAMLGAVLLAAMLIGIFGSWKRAPRYIERDEVWRVVEEEAAKYGLEPEFVYAIVAAESSFNAHAGNSGARGLMQLREPAWKTVSDKSFRKAWDWKENIRSGTAYLGWLKAFLERHERFSYPLLAASYHQGPYRVKGAGFKIEALPGSRNRIYQVLYGGEIAPVERP